MTGMLDGRSRNGERGYLKAKGEEEKQQPSPARTRPRRLFAELVLEVLAILLVGSPSKVVCEVYLRLQG